MAFQTYSPVSSPQSFSGGNGFESPSSNGGSYNNGLESMPIKKRYTKSHFGGEGFQGYNSYNASQSTEFGYQSSSSSASSSGYSSSEESMKENDTPLDFSAPKKVKNPVRAGVIRHGSKPQECLAYYFVGN